MSNRPFDLVIFDCDGVLVVSEPIINAAHAQVLTASGYSIAEDELLARFCGMSDAEMLSIIEHEWGRTLPPSYAERVGAMIEDGFGHSLVAIAGVAEALDLLRLPVCVASSSVPEQIRRKLELTGLLARFGEDLFSATMVARRPGSVSGHRGQPARYRGGNRCRDDHHRLLRREPLRAGAWRSPAGERGGADNRRYARAPDRDGEAGPVVFEQCHQKYIIVR
jgi:hypothetical protein